MVIYGDIDFTLFANEVWGSLSPMDLLALFLKDLSAKNSLIDIKLVKLTPTSKNNKLGVNGGGKLLDRFFTPESLIVIKNIRFR